MRRRPSERVRDPTLAAVAAAAEGERPLVPAGSAVLVACSGGADSTALACAFAEFAAARSDLGWRISLGHVDHGLRQASGADVALVERLAARLGLPCHVARLGRLQRQVARLGLEAAAREARYHALARLASDAGAAIVATGHTRTDQAETLLLRLARGAGPGALAGVRRARPLAPGVVLVRPLVDGVSRADTVEFCARRRLEVARDPHNLDPARARTRVRRLLPLIAGELNPRLEEALAASVALLAEEDELLAELTERALAAADRGGGVLDAAELARLKPALRRRCLLQAAVAAGARPERGHLEEISRRLVGKNRAPWALHVPGGQAVYRRGTLRWAAPADARPARRKASGEVARSPHSR